MQNQMVEKVNCELKGLTSILPGVHSSNVWSIVTERILSSLTANFIQKYSEDYLKHASLETSQRMLNTFQLAIQNGLSNQNELRGSLQDET